MIPNNVHNTLNPRRYKGESKYMLEEVYISDTCKDINNNDKSSQNIYMENNYTGEYRDGKYYFQFPSLWYTSTCNNKSIALRSIDIKNDAPNFKIDKFSIIYDLGNGTYKTVDLNTPNDNSMPYIYQNYSRTTIEDILQDLSVKVNNLIENCTDPDIKNNCHCNWYYFNTERIAQLHVVRTDDPMKTAYLSITLDLHYNYFNNANFQEIFNTTVGYVKNSKQVPYHLKFNNVWDRKECFVHASFVTGTSHNFLGKSGEFYTKPSKMYGYNGNSSEFFFTLSYDGITPINKRFASFVVQLAFIYNNSDYFAE